MLVFNNVEITLIFISMFLKSSKQLIYDTYIIDATYTQISSNGYNEKGQNRRPISFQFWAQWTNSFSTPIPSSCTSIKKNLTPKISILK